MTLSDLAALGSFVSGFAVLASLIFIGFQLRQNTRAVRAAASQAHSQGWHQITLPVVENGDFARLQWRDGQLEYETPAQQPARPVHVMSAARAAPLAS